MSRIELLPGEQGEAGVWWLGRPASFCVGARRAHMCVRTGTHTAPLLYCPAAHQAVLSVPKNENRVGTAVVGVLGEDGGGSDDLAPVSEGPVA